MQGLNDLFENLDGKDGERGYDPWIHSRCSQGLVSFLVEEGRKVRGRRGTVRSREEGEEIRSWSRREDI